MSEHFHANEPEIDKSLVDRISEWFVKRVEDNYNEVHYSSMFKYVVANKPEDLIYAPDDRFIDSIVSKEDVKTFFGELLLTIIHLEELLDSIAVSGDIDNDDDIEHRINIYQSYIYASQSMLNFIDQVQICLRTMKRNCPFFELTNRDMENCFISTYSRDGQLPHIEFSKLIVNYFDALKTYSDFKTEDDFDNDFVDVYDDDFVDDLDDYDKECSVDRDFSADEIELEAEPVKNLRKLDTEEQMNSNIDFARVCAIVFPKNVEIVFGDIK